MTAGVLGGYPEKLLAREEKPGMGVGEPVEAMSEMVKGMMELKQMIEKDTMVNAQALENLPSMDMSSFLDTLRSVITAKFELLSGLIGGIGGGSSFGNLSPIIPGGSLFPGLPELNFGGLSSLIPGQTA
ncbi:conserved hypothetical protein [Neospora caninum Liverpool]|uniref:Uncharacterized protein n=1 Tax=Neospora caninum (strain Liverpool) TaxID=572307 RepID=F0VFJ4_NEOCL|nr:conserved hypothetical protein [Neospora caninum Liverpool]CBZ52488.1 conserved hypothetical protein [Neospora caninum Liverpool]CEL66465.1 TPA: hypothetical protein BN1204_022770 [Neospora caninum Liverpool]|eukprot:XP_003882520.1 conserved hypothetical protein [Neospora caninum Liverpool]